MGAATLISVEKYLNTSYSPDMEYVDGEVVQANVGVVPGVRSRVAPARFRVPDVVVILSPPNGPHLTEPPLIVIEILSEDRARPFLAKLRDYAAWEIPFIWIADPCERRLYLYERHALVEIEGDMLVAGTPRIELTRAEIFQQ